MSCLSFCMEPLANDKANVSQGGSLWPMSLTNVFDQCLWPIVPASHPPNPLQHVSNAEVRRRTGCPPLSETIRSRRLCLFGHMACWPRNWSLPCSSCRHQQPSTRLEKTERTSDTYRDLLRWPEVMQHGPPLCLALCTGPKCMEHTCADSYSTVWGPLLMMVNR